MRTLRLAALAATCAWVFTAHARITEINVQKVEPFANGATFGNAGGYVEIGEGTHTVVMEKNRMQLFTAVQQFLDEKIKAGQ